MTKIVNFQIDEIDDHAIKVDPTNWQCHELVSPVEVTVESGDKHKKFELLFVAAESSAYATLPLGVGGDNEEFIVNLFTKADGYRAMTAEVAVWIQIEYGRIKDPFITPNEIGWRINAAYGPDEAAKTLGVTSNYLRRCKSGERRIHPTVARILRVITSFQDRPEADDRLIDLLDAAEPKIDNLIVALLSLNLDVDAAAHMLGIARSTVYNWQNYSTKIHPAAAKLLHVLVALPVSKSRSLIHRITNAARPNPHY
jgi:hypothetical protein